MQAAVDTRVAGDPPLSGAPLPSYYPSYWQEYSNCCNVPMSPERDKGISETLGGDTLVLGQNSDFKPILP